MEQPQKARSINPRTVLLVVEIVFALIVLGTSAAVINDWDTSCEPTNIFIGTVPPNNCGYYYLYPQSKVNIALFTSIIGLLGPAVILFAHLTGKSSDKVIVLIELIIYIILWIFWLSSAAAISSIVGGWNPTLQACCAFCWLSWIPLMWGSLALVILEALKSGSFSSRKAVSATQPAPAQPPIPAAALV